MMADVGTIAAINGHSPLPSNKNFATRPVHRNTYSRLDLLCVILITSFLFTLLGLALGRNNQSLEQQPNLPIIPNTPSVFLLNKTFTEAPSPETDAAWASLVPSKIYKCRNVAG